MECRSVDGGGGGSGEIVPSVITTQMVQEPFLLTDVRAHVGKHKTVIRGDDKSLQWEFCLVST